MPANLLGTTIPTIVAMGVTGKVAEQAISSSKAKKSKASKSKKGKQTRTGPFADWIGG